MICYATNTMWRIRRSSRTTFHSHGEKPPVPRFGESSGRPSYRGPNDLCYNPSGPDSGARTVGRSVLCLVVLGPKRFLGHMDFHPGGLETSLWGRMVGLGTVRMWVRSLKDVLNVEVSSNKNSFSAMKPSHEILAPLTFLLHEVTLARLCTKEVPSNWPTETCGKWIGSVGSEHLLRWVVSVNVQFQSTGNLQQVDTSCDLRLGKKKKQKGFDTSSAKTHIGRSRVLSWYVWNMIRLPGVTCGGRVLDSGW